MGPIYLRLWFFIFLSAPIFPSPELLCPGVGFAHDLPSFLCSGTRLRYCFLVPGSKFIWKRMDGS